MTKFVAAFEDFFKSIYELFASIIGTIASAVNAVIVTILNFFSGIINLFADVFKGVVDVVGGVGRFLLGKTFSHTSLDATAMLTRSFGRRQHCDHRRYCCRLCHLHSSAARKAHRSCQEDQLRTFR